jgi:hypothetical protein
LLREELGEKLVQVPIGTALGAGALYLSWKYPGFMHKLVWDKAVERALIRYRTSYAFGTSLAADEISEAIFERWVGRTFAGKAIGFSARMLGRGLFVYAVYDTIKVGIEIGTIYSGHLEAAGATSEDVSAFSGTHMVGMRN